LPLRMVGQFQAKAVKRMNSLLIRIAVRNQFGMESVLRGTSTTPIRVYPKECERPKPCAGEPKIVNQPIKQIHSKAVPADEERVEATGRGGERMPRGEAIGVSMDLPAGADDSMSAGRLLTWGFSRVLLPVKGAGRVLRKVSRSEVTYDDLVSGASPLVMTADMRKRDAALRGRKRQSLPGRPLPINRD
jgi:hypothetical protein